MALVTYWRRTSRTESIHIDRDTFKKSMYFEPPYFWFGIFCSDKEISYFNTYNLFNTHTCGFENMALQKIVV